MNGEKLFNGKDLDGWERLDGKAEYAIVNGVIVGTGVVNSSNTFLATTRTFGDFILEYEVKIDQGLNSGVQIRSESKSEVNNGHVHGYRIECDDYSTGCSIGVYDEGRRGWLCSMAYNQAAKRGYKSVQWNKFRVEAIGNSIRAWLNGIPCVNLVDDMTPMGFIALQVPSVGNDEGKAGKMICWKNIRILTKNLEANRRQMDENVVEVSYLNNTLTNNEKANGWKLLWDGKTTDGWHGAGVASFPQKGWIIEDGMLISNKGVNKWGGDIVTERKYRNFVLEADFKMTEGANSGIKYFIQSEPGKDNTIGFEYQIFDDAKQGADGSHTLASLYDLVKADLRFFDPARPIKRVNVNGVGQWNRARIEVNGKKVVHYLNGDKVLEIAKGTQAFKNIIAKSKFSKVPGFGEFEDGYILLQDHGSEVFFRNIKIKEL